MNQQASIQNIANYLGIFVNQVKASNAAFLNDINKIAEPVLIPILRIIFDCPDLYDLNLDQGNFPGVDLGDKNKRIAFQITATKGNDKIKHTLEKFSKYDLHQQFDELYVYILTEKQGFYSDSDYGKLLNNCIDFDQHKHILDFKDLMRKVQAIVDYPKIKQVENLLAAQFSYQTSTIPRLLTNPPFNSEFFIGREADLDAIETKYQHNDKLPVLVNGEGGIGKTTLAAKYWYAHEARYRHLAWLYADGGIGSALTQLAPVLGVQFLPTDDQPTQAARTCYVLANLEKPCLLVLDNANDAKDLEAFYGILHRLPNCHILLTSRVRRLANMPVYEMKPLRQDDAMSLFNKYYPKLQDADLPLLHDVLHAVSFNTLVTEVLAKNLAVLNRFSVQYSLSDLLADLQGKGLMALKNKVVHVVYGSDTLRAAKPDDIIAAMYDLAKLSEDERYLLSNLAVLPAENIPYGLLKYLLGKTENSLESSLASLEEKGWLEFRETDNSFKISPIIQEVTKAKNTQRLLPDCRTLINVLINGLNEENRHADNYRQATVIARMGLTLVQAIVVADFDLAILCQNIGIYYQEMGNINLMTMLFQKMSDLQIALLENKDNDEDFIYGLAISYEKLGEAFTLSQNLIDAQLYFEKYNNLSLKLNDIFPNNIKYQISLAVSYEKLGDIFIKLNNIEKALKFFKKKTRLSKKLYEIQSTNASIKNGLAISYFKLGGTYFERKNYETALKYLKKDIKLTKELHNENPTINEYANGLAISYNQIGNMYLKKNLPKLALNNYKKGNGLFKRLYSEYKSNVHYKNGLASSYRNLGEYYRDFTLDKDTAKSYFEQAEILFEELVQGASEFVEFQQNLEGVKLALTKL